MSEQVPPLPRNGKGRSVLFGPTEFGRLASSILESGSKVFSEVNFNESKEEQHPRHAIFADDVSRIPSEEQFIRSGLIERLTLSSDVAWLPRLMILTADEILFCLVDSNIVVERFPVASITFAAQVEKAQNALTGLGRAGAAARLVGSLGLAGGGGGGGGSPDGRHGSSPEGSRARSPEGRRRSPERSRRAMSTFSSMRKLDSIRDLQDGGREMHVLEIRVDGGAAAVCATGDAPADDGEGTSRRSHFARVETPELCAAWVADIRAAAARARERRAAASGGAWRATLQSAQLRVAAACEGTAWRVLVAAAISCDFVSSVAAAEFLPPDGSPTAVALGNIEQV